jgi:hypothetical protein
MVFVDCRISAPGHLDEQQIRRVAFGEAGPPGRCGVASMRVRSLDATACPATEDRAPILTHRPRRSWAISRTPGWSPSAILQIAPPTHFESARYNPFRFVFSYIFALVSANGRRNIEGSQPVPKSLKINPLAYPAEPCLITLSRSFRVSV